MLCVLIIELYSTMVLSANSDTFLCCPKGYVYQMGLCLENCAAPSYNSMFFCRYPCMEEPYVFSERFGLCVGTFPFFYLPVGIIRKVSWSFICKAASFERVPVLQDHPKDFTLIVTSDPQLPWWRAGYDFNCATPACIWQKARETNMKQIKAMNNIQKMKAFNKNLAGYWPGNTSILKEGMNQPISKPEGVIINGDLTAFFHTWQLFMFQNFYESTEQGHAEHQINYPIYPGLGNHDIENNQHDCVWDADIAMLLEGDQNGCALAATRYIKAALNCDTIPNFDSERLESFDLSSLAWSWNIGKWHFVQLNNYLSFTDKEIKVTSSWPWLKKDLNRATSRNQWIVLNTHQRIPDNIDQMIAEQNVVLVFAGHVHSTSQLVISPHHVLPNNNVVRKNLLGISGAVEYNKFLLIRFTDSFFNIAIIDAQEYPPKFENPNDSDKMMTFYL